MSDTPTWADLRDALEKLVDFPQGIGWHVSREAADQALEWIKWAEVHQPEPVPRILPEDDGDVSLTWRTLDGWAIHRTFSKDEPPYWLAMPLRGGAAASPGLRELLREARAEGMEMAADIADPISIEAAEATRAAAAAIRKGEKP